RRACLRRYGRRPGRVTSLTARAVSATEVMLSFSAPGTDGTNPPGAKAYLVTESRRQIRTTAAFLHAPALCDRACRFDVSSVGTTITLAVTHLRPRTTYHYGVAAFDNVSHELGPRSATVSVKTL
ncbi:MAG: fibronectin type III domain-containing protein, partial [Actinomycetota bacterium]|nr:fibronectin type III domain-containing protein [Actinomycetota bacterium]